MQAFAPTERRHLAGAAKLFALALSLWVCGCVRYYYEGKTYTDQDEVFAAQKDLFEHALARIYPVGAPLPLRARIGLPNRKILFERGTVGGSVSLRSDLAGGMSRALLT